MNLGTRLTAIADLVPSGCRMADIGTDHGYLPIYLLQQGQIRFAVAGEVNVGPYQAAQAAIVQAALGDQISLRLGDGLAVVQPGEIDAAVIAGMGGATIVDILASAPAVTARLQCIIAQPMNAAALLRQWLIEHHWTIEDEQLVKEDGRLYEIIKASPGTSNRPDAVLYDIGPILWRKRPPLLIEHLGALIAHYKRILQAMAMSEQARRSVKFKQYQQRIDELEEKRSCL